MFRGEDNFGNARGFREAIEGREAIERRARIEAEAARATRNRLEKGSPSSARLNFAGMLNALAGASAAREMPGLDAITKLREGQRHGYRTASEHNRAYEKFEKRAAEDFNRLHPDSLRRPAAEPDIAGNDDAIEER